MMFRSTSFKIYMGIIVSSFHCLYGDNFRFIRPYTSEKPDNFKQKYVSKLN